MAWSRGPRTLASSLPPLCTLHLVPLDSAMRRLEALCPPRPCLRLTFPFRLKPCAPALPPPPEDQSATMIWPKFRFCPLKLGAIRVGRGQRLSQGGGGDATVEARYTPRRPSQCAVVRDAGRSPSVQESRTVPRNTATTAQRYTQKQLTQPADLLATATRYSLRTDCSFRVRSLLIAAESPPPPPLAGIAGAAGK
jgi:hypothetical protein